VTFPTLNPLKTPPRTYGHTLEQILPFSSTQRVKKKEGTIFSHLSGMNKDGLLARLNEQDINQIISTNLTGPIHLARAFLKDMMRMKRGCIVNIGSIVGERGNVGQTAYAASKSGLVGLTKTWSKELGNRGIRVNLVQPGFIDSEMTRAMTEKKKEEILHRIPLGRFGKPEVE